MEPMSCNTSPADLGKKYGVSNDKSVTQNITFSERILDFLDAVGVSDQHCPEMEVFGAVLVYEFCVGKEVSRSH